MSDYSNYCNGCWRSYSHDPWCRFGGLPGWKGKTKEEYIEHLLSEKFSPVDEIPGVYECYRCCALTVASGREKHLESHDRRY